MMVQRMVPTVKPRQLRQNEAQSQQLDGVRCISKAEDDERHDVKLSEADRIDFLLDCCVLNLATGGSTADRSGDSRQVGLSVGVRRRCVLPASGNSCTRRKSTFNSSNDRVCTGCALFINCEASL